jgi:hypothetical protein
MARDTHSGRETPKSDWSGLADLGARQVQGFIEAQSALAKRIQDSSASWTQRLESETALASDLAAKLSRSRSPTDIAAAWQDWARRRTDLIGADVTHIAKDIQSFLAEGTQMLIAGWGGARAGGAGPS